MTARRIIPCLDVKDGRVVKGVRFEGHRDMGDAAELAARYRDEGADELVFYDITASPQGRTLDYGWVESVARLLDIPFCVAGGIRSVEQAARCLDHGADKVSINSPALERPELISEMAERLGGQCVVVGVDSRKVADDWMVHQYTGDPTASRGAGRRTLDWIVEAQRLGAGEIVLNCMDEDGVRRGYDLEQLAAAQSRLTIPLVASGGAGAAAHFVDVFEQADVSGALAASVFHTGAVRIPDLKAELAAAGVEVRP
ncbi:MAG: imidazole glycerol phosphate synthase subunit HisF [Alphaproteobacteria bacterium]|nr:imidazole glycerol phosphate synthase subunit HisF [Alphaproteobacteria bacterium]MBU1524868.1 imidazole glycerol phosphate synthase subunit HisF [Alphaproteobacteria bacterium]MBU2117249.1 imidazole glycerol phosphate synthase subunit HisF [Alphaproteobacteria bacterium]MBU2350149.1 imidazole glycerol phosphate synthase subunit HisF [Alphaproteobacteria bacterium]MBU2381950.1 imidazole glycerol phosphate synthase subunit HisF [Alphaproteobacteria bacterium]